MGFTANDPLAEEVVAGDVHASMREDAERVARYLVILRGGGLFLSATDGRLLVRWLDEGVSVLAILTAMERAVDRRRKRRIRSPLGLRNCRGDLARLLKSSGTPRPAVSIRPTSPAPVAHSAAGEPWEEADPYSSIVRAALNALDALFSQQALASVDGVAQRAMGVIQRFHEYLWEAAVDERPQLLAAAAGELQGLEDSMTEESWQRAVEAVARDRLRSRYPLLSASVVWDRLHAS